jgi:hypothetical protein
VKYVLTPWRPDETGINRVNHPRASVRHERGKASYTEYAAKGRRLIRKGHAVDCSLMNQPPIVRAMGASGVALYDLRTGQNELLIVPGTNPCWSPDGQYIAFVRDRHVLDMAVLASVGHTRVSDGRLAEGPEVWIMRGDGTEARRLAFGTWPSWSPDGNDVFYRSARENALCKIAAHDRAAQTRILWKTGVPRELLWPVE